MDVFAINIGGGTNNTLIGSTTVYIPPDEISPSVDSVWYSLLYKDRFTVVARVSDNVGVTRVRFPTWRSTDQNGEGIIWHEGIQQADGTWAATIDLGAYDYVETDYITHVYAYDMAGNYGVGGISTYIDQTIPTISDVFISDVNGSGFTVNCTAKDNVGILKVQFPTWTEDSGQDDLVSEWWQNSAVAGIQNGNHFSFRVKDSEHNYERGIYETHIYAYDYMGNANVCTLRYDFQNLGTCIAETTYNGHTYQIIDDKVTWSEAKQICEDAGGHLVIITSAEEQSVIQSILPVDTTCTGYFIGGYVDTNDSKWITGEVFEYSNWSAGEPNNGHEGTEDVYQIYLNGYWNDCQSNKLGTGFICEYDPQAILPDDIPEENIPEGFWIAGIDEDGYTYTGKAIKPEVRVYDHDTRLQAGKDYTITYKNNKKTNDATDAKTAPTIIVKGKGNYSSQETATFKILPKSISDSDITADDIVLKYNKKTQKPVPVVKRAGKNLAYKKDFTVEYVELAEGEDGANKKPGTYIIKIKGKGGYTGERTINFTITENKLMSKMSVSKIKDQIYTGSAIKPTFTVKDGKTTLTEGADYTVSYQNNTAIGVANIILKGKGNYSGEKKVTFKIKGTSITKAVVTGIPKSISYMGGPITVDSSEWGTEPVLTITVDGESKTLKEGTDYTINYQKNINKGTASILFKGMNGYSGTIKKTFVITAYDINENQVGSVTVSVPASVAYTKGGSKPKPVVKFGNNILTEGKDYTLSYVNHTKVYEGSDENKLPTVIIKGKGNYKGNVSLTYTITKQSISNLTISAPDKVYKRQKNAYKTTPKVLDINGKFLKLGTDYEKQFTYVYKSDVTLADGTIRKSGNVVGVDDIVPAGTVLVVRVKGKGNYTNSVLECEYRITQSNISKATMKVASQIYTGEEIKPGKEAITLKIGKRTLEASDYEIVGYSNNIKKGNAKITIKGIGNYGGTKTVTFKIKSKGFLWWWR